MRILIGRIFAGMLLLIFCGTMSGYAQYTAESALSLTVNGSVSGTMDTSHTDYWWKVTIPSDGKLTVTTRSDSNMEIYPYLYEKTASGYVYIAGYEGSGINNATHFDNLMAGTYYIKASRYSGYGNCTITSTFTPTSLENDIADNDSAAVAVTLDKNGSDTGHLGYYAAGYTDTNDWWKVTIPSDGKLTVATRSDSTLGIYPYLYEKTASGYVYVAGYDGSGINNATHHTNLMAGTYYIQAPRYSGCGSYTITSSFTPTSLENDIADNDSAAVAVTLDKNGSDTGHLGYYAAGYTDTNDWWKVTIPLDGKLTVTTRSDSTLGIYPYLYEKTASGYVYVAGYDGSGINNATHHTNLMAGTYYIQAPRYSGYGSYTITSSFTPTSLENDIADNDSAAVAVALDKNGSDTGHLGYYAAGYTDTNDWWKVTIPLDGKLTVTTRSDSTLGIYPYLYEKTASGYVYVAGYDGSGINNATHFDNLMAGTYYIQAPLYGGYGSYTITSAFTPALYTNDTEPNDALSAAVLLPVKTGKTGHIGYYAKGYTDPKDLYSFIVPSDWDSLFIRISTDKTLEVSVNILNTKGEQLLYNGDSGTETVFYYAKPAAGQYFLDIYRSGGYGAYAFIVQNSWRSDVPIPAEPSATTGTLAGTVTNAVTGAMIAGASVTITPGDISTAANTSGQYSAGNLTPGGGYTVVVTASGYESKIVRDITIAAGQTTTANIAMTPVTAGPVTTNLTATPNPTAGASQIKVEAVVSVNSVNKIAPFETAFHTTRLISPGKGGLGKAATVSAYEVGNTYIKASVDESSGEFFITTASGKTLLYSDFYSGNAYVRVNGQSYQFGGSVGTWITPLSISGNVVSGTWKITAAPDIQITMTLSIVRSTTTGNYDTFKISYFINNTGSGSHPIGFFKMLDTNINGNDDAPVSAGDGYNLKEREFTGSNVPNFWQAYEEGPTQASGKLVAQGTLYGGGAVKPDRMVIGDWEHLTDVTWDYTPSGNYNDSSVGMWWNPVTVSGGGSRSVATLYGLGAVESVTGQLTLAVSAENQLLVENGNLTPNPFQVNALVTNSSGSSLSDVTVRIDLPPSLTLAAGETATKTIGSMGNGISSQVKWLVVATKKTTQETYSYAVTVTTSTPNIPSNSVPKTIFVPAVAGSAVYVAGAEVFIDTDPGKGSGKAMSTVDGAFDKATESVSAVVDISGLAEGSHIVFVRGRDSNGVVGPATSYLIKKTLSSGALAPPTSVTAADVPGDQGHRIKLTWTPSVSEQTGAVTWYRILRSRSSVLTTPISIKKFATIDSLNFYDKTYTILVDSVAAGVKEYIDQGVPLNGVNYYYWLQAVGKSGASKPVAAGYATAVEDNAPLEFRVSEAWPNPFNPTTTIRYQLPESAHVRLIVYDILGRKVAVLEDGLKGSGVHEVVWNARSGSGAVLGSGVYIWQLKADLHRAQGKMMLLR